MPSVPSKTDVARFSHFIKRTAKFDLLCSKAEGRMQPGSALPEAIFAVLRTQDAPLPCSDKSWPEACTHGNSGVMEAAS